MVRHVLAGKDGLGSSGLGTVWCGEAWPGAAGVDRFGTFRRCELSCGTVRQGRQGKARLGMAGQGKSWNEKTAPGAEAPETVQEKWQFHYSTKLKGVKKNGSQERARGY